jgi:hypothetical protein
MIRVRSWRPSRVSPATHAHGFGSPVRNAPVGSTRSLADREGRERGPSPTSVSTSLLPGALPERGTAFSVTI